MDSDLGGGFWFSGFFGEVWGSFGDGWGEVSFSVEFPKLFELGRVAGFGLRVRDDEEGVDDTGDPEEKAQEDVEEELDQAAGEEDGKRREDEGDEVSHEFSLSTVHRKATAAEGWVDNLRSLDKLAWSFEQC
jgi:hypothetical protein